MDVGPRPMGLLASLALARFAVTKPLTSQDYLSQRIEEIVKPSGQQQSALEKLKQTSENAADELRASCPARIGGGTSWHG